MATVALYFRCRNCGHEWTSIDDHDHGPEFCPVLGCEYLNAPDPSFRPAEKPEPITELIEFGFHSGGSNV